MLGRSSGNHDWLLANASLAFLAVFVYATHATQAIAFEWKPGFMLRTDTQTHTDRQTRMNALFPRLSLA